MSFATGERAAPGAGVDVGSTLTKAVIADVTGRVLATAVVPTGARVQVAAARALAQATEAAGATPVCTVATGYGRYQVGHGQDVVPEIACHARGAALLWPGLATLIDVGGQDTKVIRVGEGGRVLDFHMNDKCAAGTGRFLEGAADALGLALDEMAFLAASAGRSTAVSSVCAVFAESEIGGLLADGAEAGEVAAGATDAVARRVAALVGRVGLLAPVAMSGGVSHNAAVVAALAQRLGVPVATSDRGVLAGALGAALIAADRALGVEPEARASVLRVRP